MNQPPLHPPEVDYVALYTNSLYFLSGCRNNYYIHSRSSPENKCQLRLLQVTCVAVFLTRTAEILSVCMQHFFVTRALLL